MAYRVTTYQGFGIPESQLNSNPGWDWTTQGGQYEGFIPGFDLSGKPLARPGATTGTLAGAPGQAGAGSQGGVPSVPSPQTTQAQTVAGNIGLGQDLSALAQQVTGANASGAVTPFNLNLPQYGQNWAQAAMNTGQLLQGQLPSADVQALANSVIAQRGLIGGLPADSPAVRSALARTVLGSEYAAQQQGLQNQLSMMAATPTGPAFDAASMLVTPAQQQEWQYLANVLAQSPNPDAAAWANLASLGGGMGAGYGRGPTTTQDPLQAAAAREMQSTLAQWERDRQANLGRTGTTAPTVAPSAGAPPAYGGLSAVDEAWMRELGYDPVTGAPLWSGQPSDAYAQYPGDLDAYSRMMYATGQWTNPTNYFGNQPIQQYQPEFTAGDYYDYEPGPY